MTVSRLDPPAFYSAAPEPPVLPALADVLWEPSLPWLWPLRVRLRVRLRRFLGAASSPEPPALATESGPFEPLDFEPDLGAPSLWL